MSRFLQKKYAAAQRVTEKVVLKYFEELGFVRCSWRERDSSFYGTVELNLLGFCMRVRGCNPTKSRGNSYSGARTTCSGSAIGIFAVSVSLSHQLTDATNLISDVIREGDYVQVGCSCLAMCVCTSAIQALVCGCLCPKAKVAISRVCFYGVASQDLPLMSSMLGESWVSLRKLF